MPHILGQDGVILAIGADMLTILVSCERLAHIEGILAVTAPRRIVAIVLQHAAVDGVARRSVSYTPWKSD